MNEQESNIRQHLSVLAEGVETTERFCGEAWFGRTVDRPVVLVSSAVMDFAERFAPELLHPIIPIRMGMGDVEAMASSRMKVVGALIGTEPFGRDQFVEEIFPNLRVVSRVGTGTDNVDLGERIRVLTASRSTARAVVGYDLQQAMCLLEDGSHRRLSRSRVGILGLGNIGSALWRAIEPLAGEVHGYDTSDGTEIRPDRTSAAELVRSSDVLFVHIPLTQTNIRFVDTKLMAELPSGAIVVAPVRRNVLDFGDGHVAFGRMDLKVVTDCNCGLSMVNLRDTMHTATRNPLDFADMVRESVSNLVTAIKEC